MFSQLLCAVFFLLTLRLLQVLSPQLCSLVTRLRQLQSQLYACSASPQIDWSQLRIPVVLEIDVNESELCLEAGLFESTEEPVCNPNSMAHSNNELISACAMLILSLFYEGDNLVALRTRQLGDTHSVSGVVQGQESIYSALIEMIVSTEQFNSEQNGKQQLQHPWHAFDIIRNSVDSEVWNWRHNEVLLSLQDHVLTRLHEKCAEDGVTRIVSPERVGQTLLLAMDDDEDEI